MAIKKDDEQYTVNAKLQIMDKIKSIVEERIERKPTDEETTKIQNYISSFIANPSSIIPAYIFSDPKFKQYCDSVPNVLESWKNDENAPDNRESKYRHIFELDAKSMEDKLIKAMAWLYMVYKDAADYDTKRIYKRYAKFLGIIFTLVYRYGLPWVANDCINHVKVQMCINNTGPHKYLPPAISPEILIHLKTGQRLPGFSNWK